jgi:hypothetical protein
MDWPLVFIRTLEVQDLFPATWPVWEMSAATIAYIAWAFALPNTPFAQFSDWYSPGLAGFLVLVISWGLGALAPLMQRPLPTGAERTNGNT